MPASYREHAAIAAAVAAGDPDGAQLAVQRNWRDAARRLSDVIEELGGRGDWLGSTGGADPEPEVRDASMLGVD